MLLVRRDEEPFQTFVPGHIYMLTVEQIARVAKHVFLLVEPDDPEYAAALDAERMKPDWEIGVHAMVAATDFVRAVWAMRKNVTIVPARILADWLHRNPDVRRGDDDLPQHINVAADALEGLPRAILYREVPDRYEGTSEDFLRDAERVLRSVTRRLQRLTQPSS